MKKVFYGVLCLCLLFSGTVVQAKKGASSSTKPINSTALLISHLMEDAGDLPVTLDFDDNRFRGSTEEITTPHPEAGASITMPNSYQFGETLSQEIGNGTEISIRLCNVDTPYIYDASDLSVNIWGPDIGGMMNESLDYNTVRPGSFETINENNFVDVKIQVVKKADGSYGFIFKTDRNFKVDGKFKATYVTINGKKYTLGDANTFYIADGEGALPLIPIDNPEPEDTKINGSAGVELKKSTHTYKDMDGNVKGRISSDKYDVTTAIPTSENLTYYLEADKSLFEIQVREYTVRAWIGTAKVNWYSTYEEREYEWNDHSYKNKSGDWVGDWEWTGRWIPAQASKNGTISGLEVFDKYYDVIKSDIYNAIEGYDLASNGSYSLKGTITGLTGTVNPGTKTIQVWLNTPTDSFSFCVRKSWKR